MIAAYQDIKTNLCTVIVVVDKSAFSSVEKIEKNPVHQNGIFLFIIFVFAVLFYQQIHEDNYGNAQ